MISLPDSNYAACRTFIDMSVSITHTVHRQISINDLEWESMQPDDSPYKPREQRNPNSVNDASDRPSRALRSRRTSPSLPGATMPTAPIAPVVPSTPALYPAAAQRHVPVPQSAQPRRLQPAQRAAWKLLVLGCLLAL